MFSFLQGNAQVPSASPKFGNSIMKHPKPATGGPLTY